MPSQPVQLLPFDSLGINRVHRLLVEAVLAALTQTFYENQYADKVLEKIFKNHREWGARDRRFIAETFYECVRWWRKYWFVLNEEISMDRLALLRLWAVHWLLSGNELPDWTELKGFDVDVKQRLKEAETQEAIFQSLPDWMYERGLQELGKKWTSILKALNQTAAVDLRCNTLKIIREELQRRF